MSSFAAFLYEYLDRLILQKRYSVD